MIWWIKFLEKKAADISLKQFQDSLDLEYQMQAKKIGEVVNGFAKDTLCSIFIPDTLVIALHRKKIIEDVTGFMFLHEEYQKLLIKSRWLI